MAAWGSLGYCQPIVGWGHVHGLEYPRTGEDWLVPELGPSTNKPEGELQNGAY